MAEYMRRFATGLDTYEFAEVRSEDAADFEEAVAFMLDHVGGSTPTEKAVETVKRGFGKTTEVRSGGFGDKGRQAQQSEPEDRELGERDGYKITVKKSKFGGVYFNAYNSDTKERINSKSVKGLTVNQATIEDAVEHLSEAA